MAMKKRGGWDNRCMDGRNRDVGGGWVDRDIDIKRHCLN